MYVAESYSNKITSMNGGLMEIRMGQTSLDAHSILLSGHYENLARKELSSRINGCVNLKSKTKITIRRKNGCDQYSFWKI
jgi:hypothetical protein